MRTTRLGTPSGRLTYSQATSARPRSRGLPRLRTSGPVARTVTAPTPPAPWQVDGARVNGESAAGRLEPTLHPDPFVGLPLTRGVSGDRLDVDTDGPQPPQRRRTSHCDWRRRECRFRTTKASPIGPSRSAGRFARPAGQPITSLTRAIRHASAAQSPPRHAGVGHPVRSGRSRVNRPPGPACPRTLKAAFSEHSAQ